MFCTSCKSEIELDENELRANFFVCPACGSENKVKLWNQVKDKLITLYILGAILAGFWTYLRDGDIQIAVTLLLPLVIITQALFGAFVVLSLIWLLSFFKAKFGFKDVVTWGFWMTIFVCVLAALRVVFSLFGDS